MAAKKLTRFKEARRVLDDLGVINEQRRLLEKREDFLKAVVKDEFGPGTHNGDEFVVSVAWEDRFNVDMEALCKAYRISKSALDSYRRNKPCLVLTCARIEGVEEISRPPVRERKERTKRKQLDS